jgi:hypothetical protein
LNLMSSFVRVCMLMLFFERKVEEIRQREMDMTRETIQRILATGAKVILTTKGIDDLCLKYFVEAGAIAVRRVLKEDLKRIAKVQCLPTCFLYCTCFYNWEGIRQLAARL